MIKNGDIWPTQASKLDDRHLVLGHVVHCVANAARALARKATPRKWHPIDAEGRVVVDHHRRGVERANQFHRDVELAGKDRRVKCKSQAVRPLDRVIEIDGYQRAVAIKNVSINEPYFAGHFPEQPLMPGVLQLEAMAQLAGVLLLRKLENTGKLAVLWSIDKVKLRAPVVPGDQLRIEVETMRMKGQIAKVQGKGSVAGRAVCEAILTFTMVDP